MSRAQELGPKSEQFRKKYASPLVLFAMAGVAALIAVACRIAIAYGMVPSSMVQDASVWANTGYFFASSTSLGAAIIALSIKFPARDPASENALFVFVRPTLDRPHPAITAVVLGYAIWQIVTAGWPSAAGIVGLVALVVLSLHYKLHPALLVDHKLNAVIKFAWALALIVFLSSGTISCANQLGGRIDS